MGASSSSASLSPTPLPGVGVFILDVVNFVLTIIDTSAFEVPLVDQVGYGPATVSDTLSFQVPLLDTLNFRLTAQDRQPLPRNL